MASEELTKNGNIDLDNPEFQNAWNLVCNTHRSVFLTGKAGTGKSTFLRYICAHTKKKYVVLAPTGIAAVNVGGQTLHSFFKIPFKPLLPDDPEFAINRIRKTMRYPKNKIKLIRELQLIIVDEISMVRADVIDFVDRVLRVFSGNMREPFGGKQLLFVGDVFQLEPVVTRDMREILRRYYNQFFFFNAHVFSQLGLVPIELKKIYRQNNPAFIALLDRVRINRASEADMAVLNSRYDSSFQETSKFAMTLATRRDTVNAINEEHMAAIKSASFTYEGLIDGVFPENDLPTLLKLELKKGAQVMFIRNDKENRWYNGTIGRVASLGKSSVSVELENGNVYELEPEMWENIQYTFDEKEKKVLETTLGTFTQYPVKPAWALTVHKSQGLTFNNIVIDFAGGAFTSGQTYVALSRCTSLEGITLLKPLSQRDIIVSQAIIDFSRQFNDQRAINEAFEGEKLNLLLHKAVHAFDHNEFRTSVDSLMDAVKMRRDIVDSVPARRLMALKLGKFHKQEAMIGRLEQVIDAQNQLLKELSHEYVEMGNQALGMGGLVGEDEIPYGGGSSKQLDDIVVRSALANFDKAMRIWPDSTEARIGKAKLLAKISMTDEAKTLLEQAIGIDKKCYDAHLFMGELLERNDVPLAVKSLKRAVKLKAKRPEAHEALGRIYERLGFDDLSKEEFALAKKLRQPAQEKSKKRK